MKKRKIHWICDSKGFQNLKEHDMSPSDQIGNLFEKQPLNSFHLSLFQKINDKTRFKGHGSNLCNHGLIINAKFTLLNKSVIIFWCPKDGC